MAMHNGRNRIASSKRDRNCATPQGKLAYKQRKSPPGPPGSMARATGAKGGAQKADPIRVPLRSFPCDAIVHASWAAAPGDRNGVIARSDQLRPEPKRFATRPGLMERALLPARPNNAGVAVAPDEDMGDRAAPALQLPPDPEPLVASPAPDLAAPLPRERALVPTATGLIGKLVRWLSGSARRLRKGDSPAARNSVQHDRPDVALLRAELRELRAELAIARRVAERREVLAKARAREAIG